MKAKAGIVGLLIIAQVLLTGCDLSSQATPVPAQPIIRTFSLSNCNSQPLPYSFNQQEAIKRFGKVSAGVQIKVVDVSGSVEYSEDKSSSTSFDLTIPPQTNVTFTLVGVPDSSGIVGNISASLVASPCNTQGSQPQPLQTNNVQTTIANAANTTSPVIVASATRVPTSTPVPPATNTPIPVPTTPPDTAPESVLEVGQSWRQGGVSLKLTKFSLEDKAVWVWFDITNLESSTRTFKYSIDNYSASLPNGQKLQTGAVGNYMFTQQCRINSVVLNADETQTLLAGSCTVNYPNWSVQQSLAIIVDYANPAITEVIVTAEGISSISKARWRISFKH
jgi:hypothetical protein